MIIIYTDSAANVAQQCFSLIWIYTDGRTHENMKACINSIKFKRQRLKWDEAKKILIDIGRYKTSNKDENIKISYNA